MSRIINNEILAKIGKPSEMVDDMLDKQIESIETDLGERAKGVGNRILGYFLVNGNRIQLHGTEVVERLQTDMKLESHTANSIIDTLQHSGILRKTTGDKLEIANNFLAQRAQQKVESENRVLRTIKTTIQDRMSRNELLDQVYLNHILPSIPLLDLNEQEMEFIKASQRALRSRRRVLAIVRTIAFLVLACMTTVAVLSSIKAGKSVKELEENNALLKIATDRATAAADSARIAQDQAEQLRNEAVQLKQIAEKNATDAIIQAKRVEELLLFTKKDRDSISNLNKINLKQLADLERLSQQYQAKAEENKRLAEDAQKREIQALEARSKAEKLNLVITSWNAAARSLQIEDARTKALVAMEAYNINRDNPDVGDIKHPNIMKALLDASGAMDINMAFDIKKAQRGAIRDIVFQPGKDVFFTTGSDGAVKKWVIENWNMVGAPEIAKSPEIFKQNAGVNNTLAISPNGKRLLVAGEMDWFQTLNAETGKLQDTFRIEKGEEIFAAGIADNGEFIAAGFQQFYHYAAGAEKVKTNSKNRGKASLIMPVQDQICAYGLAGKYEGNVYRFNVDSLCTSSGGSSEFNIYGSSREVDFGVLSAISYQPISEKTAIVAIGFSNGRILLIESDRNGDRFLPNGEQARKMFKPHLAAITDFAFSPDGTQLAVASLDGTITLWDLRKYTSPTYQPVIFDRNAGWVFSVAFSNDGRFLVAGCQDGSLFFWNVDPTDYARFLCSSLNNTLAYAQEEQRKVDKAQKKSPEIYNLYFDELAKEDYRRYFGEIEPGVPPRRRVRVCD